MITIQSLTKQYGNKLVFKNLHFTLESGYVYGIVGENGAGKTTLFKCICGLEKYEGTINSNYKPLKNYVGYLPTEIYFLDKITGKEYLHLLCNARGISIKNIAQKNIFNLPLEDYIVSYSTGMKKKLALTAILLQNNPFYILDEPFNGVDIQSNLLISEIILELKRLGKTVLISSHIFATLKETCDAIFVLKNGEISTKITPENYTNLEQELKQYSGENLIRQLDLK